MLHTKEKVMRQRVIITLVSIWVSGYCVACGAGRAVSQVGRRGVSPHAATVVDATWRGDRARLTALLRAGVDVNRRGTHGQTALEGAAWHGDERAVDALLRAGAVVGAPNTRALQFAAVRGHAAIVRRLLVAGADPDVRDGSGRSPLSLAALGGHLAVVEALLDAGAETELRSDTGMTALMHAAAHGHPDIVAELVRHGANVAARRDDGSTAWTLAVERNDTRMMQILHASTPRVGSAPPVSFQ